jgi:hypothetical protein
MRTQQLKKNSVYCKETVPFCEKVELEKFSLPLFFRGAIVAMISSFIQRKEIK